jgi:predicted dehydrogenase
MLSEGRIGRLQEVHYYDGNRGPLWHTADKIETRPTPARKRASWFYKAAAGGGSLLDYLGYGATLGTWYHGGRKPLEVMAMVDRPRGLEVDEHSVTIARYASGLSKFETRWGTFTDPWTHQPQPKCGFVLKGTEGTIASYDFEKTIRLQTARRPAGEDLPVDRLRPAAPESDRVFPSLHRRGQTGRGAAVARHLPHRPADRRFRGAERPPRQDRQTRRLNRLSGAGAPTPAAPASLPSMSEASTPSGYGLAQAGSSAAAPAPDLTYLPPRPRAYRPRIALIGCGGISEYHLRAYRALDLEVAALCDVDGARAERRRAEFYPAAAVVTDYTALLRRDDIEVVDLALHPRRACRRDRGGAPRPQARAQPEALRARSRHRRPARRPR